jgi:hypothetical protein
MPKLFRRIVRKGSCADRLWTADKFFHRVDDREFRPPVSVEVSMRETKRTRQQAYPDAFVALTLRRRQHKPSLVSVPGFLGAGFRTFDREFPQNLLRCHISLIAEKPKCCSLLYSSTFLTDRSATGRRAIPKKHDVLPTRYWPGNARRRNPTLPRELAT